MRKTFSSLTAVLLIALLVAACGSTGTGNTTTENPPSNTGTQGQQTEAPPATTDNQIKTSLSIGTSPIGSSLNAVGSGIASVVSQNSEIKMTTKPFAGYPAIGPLLDKGELDLGFDTMPSAAWSYRGEYGFEKIKNQRLVARGNFIMVTGPVVRADSGINTVADLKGKRVASDYPAAPTPRASQDAVLAGNGLSWDDVRKVPVPTNVAGIEALRDNRLDAASMMTPTTPIVVETHTAIGLKGLNFVDGVPATEEGLKSIPKEQNDLITSFMPGSRLGIQEPVGFVEEPTIGLEYPTALMATSHLNEETVYQLTKILFEHYEKLHPIHLWLQSWSPEQMFDPNPTVPYHPGAVKYYKEIGLWNDDLEKLQEELLNLQ